MKISSMRTLRVEVPLDKPLITAIHNTETLGCVLVILESDTGLRGENFIFVLDKTRLHVLEAMIQSLSKHVVGQDAWFVEKIWQDMFLDINALGTTGIAVSAISAIDTAIWDMLGKQAQTPLHQMFGACRTHIKAYASSGLWLSASIDELVEEAHEFVAQGFLSVKLRIGKEHAREDIARVAALRAALGDGIEILTDANQSLSVREAISRAKLMEPYLIGWLEEPLAAHDLAGHARVRDNINMPLASGESDYTRWGMKAILDAGAVDVLMPDLQRIGGLSEFRRTAALASAYNVPISTHIFTEQSLSIAGSAANCISVEHVSWFSPLYQEQVQIKGGEIEIPTGHGLGFTFDEDFIAAHTVS